ncbi:preprotein translocase subunit SecA [Pseudobacteriovorax antillogorgiicola]|uniref:Protein translocase subunit SecA n=1 Tax=Pseudobacteriovorax antillogorgiicola TaxID=1513793 RepID=A0A1Y6B5H6_9BACT|nr:preprotein translocase subunit SecA [Pseudobacteriovorax antillogorgiicola]TCS59190.1 protein translocase subunit secA [Pseudobacteriovorax antillogorgiicola]SME90763.1 protein translocase subunit secA [Pseudobacteriovorax antillogorgiicola]
MLNLAKKIFGTKNDRELKRYRMIVDDINKLESSLEKLSDDELRQKTQEFKDKLAKGATQYDILPEAFATVREASKRTLGMRHFDVQMVGGIALFEGRIAEMKTGEGKTLTATLPVYLHALSGKGAHVVTVNDYLASTQSEEMGQLYGFLGMTTGLIVHGLNDEQRREAYHSDITYGTNNEFGFDYLRDNMKTDLGRYVQRDHNFCIVDEVDSILIDEARTPLIISGPAETNTEIYATVNATIPGLQKDSDYIVDEKSRNVSLTEDGISKLEKRLRVENLYDPSNIEYLHHVQQALKAHVVFKKDVDYVVRDNKVIIVDEFTGRLMPGRRYSDGLHGALEAKEHLPVENETQVLASITFQNYFRLYSSLAGMTGTADTEAVEFKKIYELDVVVIPTNKPIARQDDQDEIYRTAREKFNVIADEIAKAQKQGQPVLVGTVSVEKSELLASLLRQRNIPHEILNAKNHGREASIIANAGQKGNVTISTNMAGRGTDIKLGEGVSAVGGLFVIGTERHESRRIDNQLRGRSGRQGDPGRSKFFLSLEDDLMRIFASDRLSAIMSRLGMKEGEAIISPMVTRAIEKAQKRVEEQNFSSRKHVLEYDDVMNQQRKVVYGRRRNILDGTVDLSFMKDSVEGITEGICAKYSPELTNQPSYDMKAIQEELSNEFHMDLDLNIDAEDASMDALLHATQEIVLKHYNDKKLKVSEDIMKKVEAFVYLQILDQTWKDHLRAMDQLQDNVRLRGYAQRDPLQEYKKEAFNLFESMMGRIEDETTLALVRMPPPELATEQDLEVEEPDTTQMNFAHPEAGPAQAAPAPSGNAEDDGMIYHGSRSGHVETEPKAQPFKRDLDKIGRNDPCPCGSGKKFKKCHGRPGAEPLA